MKDNILIADDDPKICALISDIIRENGFHSLIAKTTEEAWDKVISHRPSLILLDVEIPLKGGLEFCRELKSKEEYRQVPIIFVTVRDQELDRVSALNLGADDFITKPFRPKELIARINVVLRRYTLTGSSSLIVRSGSLFADFNKRIIQSNNKDIHLTPKEFELFELLCKNRHRVLSDKNIFERIWGSHCRSQLSTVYTHMDRLRRKLKTHGSKIKTVPGMGYRFDERSR